MKRLRILPYSGLLLALLVVTFLSPAKGFAHEDYKLIPGMPFTYFELEDINRQRWVSSYLQGKPIIILTGHRFQRYEMLKWAESIKRDFWANGAIHMLWVVNLRHYPFSTSRGNVTDYWRRFAPPVPVLLDWHGVVGHSMRINYGVPNIIGIDAAGRLAFHEMHSYSPEVYAAVAQKIAALAGSTPGYLRAASPTPIENQFNDQVPQMSPMVPMMPGPNAGSARRIKGKKGDSN